MPFSKKIETEAGIIGIWEITETAESIQKDFVFLPSEKIEFEKIKAEKRKIDFLATRLMVKKILGEKTVIDYLDTGKPFLKNRHQYISISHSADAVVVIISDEKTGIDVELANRKIDRVAKRFLSLEEFLHIQNLEQAQIAKIIYWGAKESIFKCSDYQGVHFYKQIHIHAFPIENEGTFNGKLIANDNVENFRLWYFTFQNNIVVFCVEDKNITE